MELELSSTPVSKPDDRRPRLLEPLPVKLIAVDDVRLPAPAGVEPKLDWFYVDLLGFERSDSRELVYRADNFYLRFDVLERPVVHDSLRPTGIEIISLIDMEKRIIEAELEYARQRGLTPGQDTLLLLDPAGNWIELSESRTVQ